MYHRLLDFVNCNYRRITLTLYGVIAICLLIIILYTIQSHAEVLDAKAESLVEQGETLKVFYKKLLETEPETENVEPVLETEETEEVENESETEITEVDETETEYEVDTEDETESETEPLYSEEELEWMEAESDALYNKYYDIMLDRALYTVEYFVDCGFSVEGASGIAGNIYAESNFNGSADNSGCYHGICQWDTSNRWYDIANYAYSNYGSTEDFFAQIDAILNSADGAKFQDTFAVMREMSSAEDAAIYWLYYYEIAPGQAEQKRMEAAKLVRLKYLLQNA